MAIDFPNSPNVNDTYTVDDKTFIWTGDYWRVLNSPNYISTLIKDADNDTKVEVEQSADEDIVRITTGGTERYSIGTDGHIIPTANEAYDLGSASNRFRDLYLSGTSIDLGGVSITSDGANLALPPISSVSGDFTVDTDTLHVDSTNNRVGIGTTVPAGLLSVMHAEPDGSVDFSKGIVFMRSDGAGGGWTHAGITSVGYTGFDGGIVFGTDNDGTFNTSGIVERMRITDSGNVGIGTTTPAAQLEISNTGSGQIYATGDGFYVDQNGSQLDTLFLRSQGPVQLSSNLDGGTSNDYIQFLTAAGTERMRINAIGDVGIGTASPAANLQVISQNRAVSIIDSGVTNIAEVAFTSLGADSPAFGRLSGYDVDIFSGTTRAGLASRIHVNRGGNVGIGTTSPSYKLDVNGLEDTASRVNISSGNTAYRYHMRFSRNNSLLANGIFSDTGATYFGNASDVNLKTGISDLSKQDALAAVSSLRPVEYRYLLDTEDVVRKGFIAQEMVEVIPEAVHRVGGGHPATSLIYDENGDLVATDVDENGDPIVQQEPDWMMTWEPITTTLVAAVQAQQELIQELTARIEALEAN